MSDLKTAAIVAAAGEGIRFGGADRKQFRQLLDKPIIAHSLKSLNESQSVSEIILVVPVDSINRSRSEIVDRFQFEKVTNVISGGKKRQDSVEIGFNSISENTDIVIVHDAVRPFITNQMIELVIKEAQESGGVITAIPVNDTVKKLYPDIEQGIESTISRDNLWLAQTPQAFKYKILKDAYKKAREDGFIGTDESSLVERMGVRVRVIEGSKFNIKITKKEDLMLGELIVEARVIKSNRAD